jgi:citrate/tricarballylate utilization protein
VWDAIELKDLLNNSDAAYLANLCHDCRDCYYACPYNEPDHEFKLNIPKAMGDMRYETYTENIRPRFMKKLLEFPILITAGLTAMAIVISLLYAFFGFGFGRFQKLPITAIIPDYLFRTFSLFIYAYTIILWSWEGHSYLKTISDGKHIGIRGLAGGLYDAFMHTNFKGGGMGCKMPNENSRYTRIVFHVLVLFGFIIALIAISFYPNISGYVAIVYLIGSIFLATGSFGMIAIHLMDKSDLRSKKMSLLDYPFSLLLFASGFTGVLVVLSVGTSIYNWNFLIHDALILLVFLLAPYSKFIHPIYRTISLIKYRSDKMLNSSI